MTVWLLAIRLLKDYTAPYSDQIPYHPSPSLNKLLLSLSIFCFLVFNPGWKVFLLTISIPYDLLIFFSSSPHQLGDFLSIDPLSDFPLQSPITGLEVSFTNNMILLRLLSFFTGLKWSYWSPGFPPQSTLLVERFFTRFLFKISSQQTTTHLTEFASKGESNCNDMVTKPTNSMISACSQWHDLLTWSQHVTYEVYPDTKSSSIPISALSFILTSSYYWL